MSLKANPMATLDSPKNLDQLRRLERGDGDDQGHQQAEENDAALREPPENQAHILPAPPVFAETPD